MYEGRVVLLGCRFIMVLVCVVLLGVCGVCCGRCRLLVLMWFFLVSVSVCFRMFFSLCMLLGKVYWVSVFSVDGVSSGVGWLWLWVSCVSIDVVSFGRFW